MILKHKGNNITKITNNNLNRVDQRYISELLNSRNGSHSQINQYENMLNVEVNE